MYKSPVNRGTDQLDYCYQGNSCYCNNKIGDDPTFTRSALEATAVANPSFLHASISSLAPKTNAAKYSISNRGHKFCLTLLENGCSSSTWQGKVNTVVVHRSCTA